MTNKSLKKYSIVGRDVGLMMLVVFVFWLWQTNDLLDADADIAIPNQRFVDLNGDVLELVPSDKKTLLYFFAPWCGVCEFSIGNLEVIDQHKYNVIRVALSYDTKEDVERFVSRNKVLGEVVLGSRQHAYQFNISAYPTYYILDERLHILSGDMGYSTAAGISLRTAYFN